MTPEAEVPHGILAPFPMLSMTAKNRENLILKTRNTRNFGKFLD
jgi:hypothetical protein